MKLFVIVTVSLLLTVAVVASRVAARDDLVDQKRIDSFQLQDYRGKSHSLDDMRESPLVVVYFLGTECPLAKLYGPRIEKLYQRYRDQGVAVVGINSNSQDSITELAAHARLNKLTFPILKDVGNKVADQFGAQRTPQVFVLDEQRIIRYRGRVDAQFTFGAGVGLAQPRQARHDLRIAIEELLAGKTVTIPETEAKGCLIGRVRAVNDRSDVTYCRQIAPILQNRCVECHREGQIAPFALTDYEEVAGWGEMIAEVVRQQRMPPWHANPAFGHFSNDLRMTEEEKRLVYEWVSQGCPEGEAADLPQPRTYHEGWFLTNGPDEVFHIAESPVSVKAEGVEPYRHYEVDPGFVEDKWVSIAECMPDNRAVVHHIIVYTKPPGTEPIAAGSTRVEIRGLRFLVAFAPGTRPLAAPPGWAKKIPAGHTLVFQMHYTPIGTPQADRSSVGLVYTDKQQVTHMLATASATNSKFAIPPHASNYRVESERRFKTDTQVLSLFPHMHMRGKAFRYELQLPDGKREVLLDVPRYDFNWQNYYQLAQPRHVPAKSKLICTAWYDNSSENLANPDPTKEIRWGPQTWDEMMIGFYDFGVPIAQQGAHELEIGQQTAEP